MMLISCLSEYVLYIPLNLIIMGVDNWTRNYSIFLLNKLQQNTVSFSAFLQYFLVISTVIFYSVFSPHMSKVNVLKNTFWGFFYTFHHADLVNFVGFYETPQKRGVLLQASKLWEQKNWIVIYIFKLPLNRSSGQLKKSDCVCVRIEL